MIKHAELTKLYTIRGLSSSTIAIHLKCSPNTVNYWLRKYHIPKRTISEAVYLKHNPAGDPFKFKVPANLEEMKLFGLGLGLYWGEGNKANKNTVRLGNVDPELLKTFINFLTTFFGIRAKDLRFHLQIFSDIDPKKAVTYWRKHLHFNNSQLYKPTITISGSLGSYRQKSQYGVMTVYYSNVKLRNLIISLLLKERTVA